MGMTTTVPSPSAPGAFDERVDRSVLRALVHLASLVTSSHDALSTIEAVAETARGLLGAASVSIESWDPERQLLTTLVNVGDLGPGEVRWPVDETYEMAVFPQAASVLDGQRYTVNLAHLGDGVSDPAELALLESLGKTSCLHAPVLVEGTLWGLLYATRTAEQPVFDAYTAELSEVVVALISAGLVQAAAWQRLQDLASTDPMTGLSNRRLFDERLRVLLAGTVRPPGFALVLGDVDGLKGRNDTRGHPAGDAALVSVADAARRAVLDVPGAVAARLGGDEFALLLPALDADEAFRVAAGWCEASRDPATGISLSVGVAAVSEGSHLPAAVFGRADRAMYASKQARTGTPVLAPG